MKMSKLYRILWVLTLCLPWVARAQEVSPVDFMRMNPFQINSNPAADLPYMSAGAFAVGNLCLTQQNTGLRYDNLFDFDAQGRPKYLNPSKFANSLKENNSLAFNMKENVFFGGFRQKKGFLTVAYNINAQGLVGFDKGLFDLLAKGNSAFLGEDNPAKGNMGFNAQAYQEWAVGYQLNVTRKLSLGARAKLLFGGVNVNTDALSLKVVTDPDTYAIRIYEDIAMNLSLPAPARFENGKLLTNGHFAVGDLFKNVGFGLDLGAEYRFDEQFSMVAAVTDLGFIKWKNGTYRLYGGISDAGQFYENGNFLFEGLDVDQLQRIISDEHYRELFMDTLRDYFRIGSEDLAGYKTSLRTNLMLRGNYDIDAQNRVSAQVQGCFREDGFRPAMTLAYSGSFFDMLDVCATYTMMRGSYTNIGLGLGGNFGTFHIYAATSNIFGVFTPLNAKNFNLQAGIVFNFREADYTKGTHAPRYLE